jgi:Glycosyl transferase family 2
MQAAASETRHRLSSGPVRRAPSAACIVVPAPTANDYRRAFASLTNQTEPLNAIIAIGDAAEAAGRDKAELGASDTPLRWIEATGTSQIGALNKALAAVDSQLVFFLRADDVWTPDHLAAMRRIYADRPEHDFVFCDAAHAKTDGQTTPLPDQASDANSLDLGFTAVATYIDLDFVGGPLSCLSMRRAIIDRIAPLPDDVDWRQDVNTCLVLGASLAGARKCQLPRPLAMVADSSLNLSGDHRRRLAADFVYRLKVLRLVGKLTRHLRLDGNSILAHAGLEYQTQPANDWSTFATYRRYVERHVTDEVARARMFVGLYRRVREHLRQRRTLANRMICLWLKWTLCAGSGWAR